MNLLYVCQRVPFPPDRGDKIASYSTIRHLAKRHRVFVAALADSPQEAAFADGVRELGVEIEVVRMHRWGARFAALKGLLGKQPLSLTYFRSRRLSEVIARRAREEAFDLVLTFSSSMGPYARLVPNVPLVADLVDLDSQKWVLYAEHSRWPRSLVYRSEARRLLRYERELTARAALSLVTTEAEREDAQRLLPGAALAVYSNGVDLEYFQAAPYPVESKQLVFTGVMDYWPNSQGVAYFANEILPLIRRSVPGCTFTIVGSRPTKEVKALARDPGVTVTGRVPDVRSYLRSAAVVVVPLLMARGIQNKILEAMATARPIVTTSMAGKGVDAGESDGVFAADGPAEFATRVIELLESSEKASQLGAEARRRVEDAYVWEKQVAHLEGLLEAVCSRQPPRAARGDCP